MAYAKTSLRGGGEQRALRERIRTLGLSHRQIAVEFARRYQLRPRAVWRHAYGWSLKEAAERISDYAARSGLDPDGATVAHEEVAGRPSVHRLVRQLVTSAPSTVRRDAARFAAGIGVSP